MAKRTIKGANNQYKDSWDWKSAHIHQQTHNDGRKQNELGSDLPGTARTENRAQNNPKQHARGAGGSRTEVTNNQRKRNRGWPTRLERSTHKRMKDSTKGDGGQKSTTARKPERGKINGRALTGPSGSRGCRATQKKMGEIWCYLGQEFTVETRRKTIHTDKISI